MLTDEKIEEVLSEIDVICEDIFDGEDAEYEAQEIADPSYAPPTGVITC